MKAQFIDTFRVAAPYAAALNNDDFTALSSDERKMLNDFVQESVSYMFREFGEFEAITWTLPIQQSETFFARCDISGMYADCLEVRLYTFLKFTEND
jgi:hypothetical protein